LGVDPVVLASSIVMRLQTIVSREIGPSDVAVVTVGSVQAGQKSNIIPDNATLLINTRAYDKDVEKKVHAAIERIVKAECVAAGSPKDPEIEYYDVYPLTVNDDALTAKVRAAFDAFFGEDSIDITPQSASEDFSIIPDEVNTPYAYWGLGGFADQENAPGNHNPAFAPDLQPTLDRGAEAAVVAASAWLVGE
ncbi:MAG: M20/M25/M40 family metallo-hydrolase, partial [Corynebacterium glucuronolyticum]|nr:M20/M25/M40 family metallo-hydrolase [Corynebacterium glucuronolyticum]MDD7587061.1 M20/M25/M40 family metallo-hydrolase [Mycobacteriaceae bacterium]MDY5834368.1 M20/M25/M40 family metallo-hydrolase [Corynebacterium glucuronolyticum]